MASQVKPRRDPWQQKVIMNLLEKCSVEELLKTHSRFLQVSVAPALSYVLIIKTVMCRLIILTGS